MRNSGGTLDMLSEHTVDRHVGLLVVAIRILSEGIRHSLRNCATVLQNIIFICVALLEEGNGLTISDFFYRRYTVGWNGGEKLSSILRRTYPGIR